MKNLLFFVAVGLSVAAYGQTPQFELGVRAGYNYATFGELKNTTLEYNRNAFVMAGAFAQVRVLKKLGLRADILYNPKGALMNYVDSNGVKVEGVRKLTYTDISLSASYNISLAKMLGLYVFAGYNYERLGKAKDIIEKPSAGNVTLNDIEDKANSVIAGVGLRLRLLNVSILPEVRYLHGLTDVVNTNVVSKNRVFTASLGVSFAL